MPSVAIGSEWYKRHGISPRKASFVDGLCYLPLTQGKIAIVDVCFLPEVEKYRWTFSHGYALRNDAGRRVYLHHFILTLSDNAQPDHVDHINGNPLDNRLRNLRYVDRSDNQINRGLQSNNTSGYRGVYFSHGKWSARIKRKGVVRTLGSFAMPEEAAAAYDAAAVAHGGICKLNLTEK